MLLLFPPEEWMQCGGATTVKYPMKLDVDLMQDLLLWKVLAIKLCALVSKQVRFHQCFCLPQGSGVHAQLWTTKKPGKNQHLLLSWNRLRRPHQGVVGQSWWIRQAVTTRWWN